MSLDNSRRIKQENIKEKLTDRCQGVLLASLAPNNERASSTRERELKSMSRSVRDEERENTQRGTTHTISNASNQTSTSSQPATFHRFSSYFPARKPPQNPLRTFPLRFSKPTNQYQAQTPSARETGFSTSFSVTENPTGGTVDAAEGS